MSANMVVRICRLESAEEHTKGKSSELSVDDIIEQIKDRIARHQINIRKAFEAYDTLGKGKIRKSDFRQVSAGNQV